ncbi:MAG: FG-GAP-like repeat-containing protein [Tepidisphaeraceae bacterium]
MPRAVHRAAVMESLERRAYLAVQVSFTNGIIDDPSPLVPVSFTIGHFNGGSTPDVAVHYHWSKHGDVWEVLLGQGDGSLQLGGGVLNKKYSDGPIATGDWNGDGKLDLFAYVGFYRDDFITIEGWRGNGQGDLFDGSNADDDAARIKRFQGSVVNYTTADMNGDGKTDIINIGGDGLQIWSSIATPGATGSFSGITVDNSTGFATVNALDVNGDGRRDIITTNLVDGRYKITVKLKNADGGYSSLTSSALTTNVKKLRMADFNRDGKLDAAILETHATGSYVDICFGNGDGSFGAPLKYALNADVSDFTVADIDFDGRPDVAFTLPTVPGLGLSRSFGLLHNRGDGTMERVNSPQPDLGTNLIDSADFNNDGKADLIVRYADTNQIAVLLNKAVPRNVIRGTVFNDLNEDQIRQANEPGVADRRIYVDVNDDGEYDANEATSTLADGTWEMRVPNGTYRIRQELPPRWKQTTPYGFGAKSVARDVTVSGIVSSLKNDFGTYDQGNITGSVYRDSNANKIRDSFEGGYGTQTVYLDLNGNKTWDFMEPYDVTDANGRYKLIADNGTYTVRTDVQPGWKATGTTVYTAKVTSSASFNPGLDFGQTQPATISGHVYYDFAANGRTDSGDVGVGGLQLFVDFDGDGVRDANEPSTTSSTSADLALKGGYKFTGLDPDTYNVRLVKPAGYQQVAPSIAGEGRGGPFRTFAFGGYDTTYTDFGVIRPINVSGRAFGDSNANGAIDTGELGLPDVPVFIDYDADGLPDLDEPQRLTDGAGNFTLASTREGTFNVRALRRSGLSSTVPSSSVRSVNFAFDAATTTGRNFGFTVGAFSTAPYEAPININTGSNPTALAGGDFNGDGRQDFIVASNSSVSRVFIGGGNGLFTAGQELSIGDSTRYMIAVDVSGDGKPDLVAANEALDFGASVLIGNGNGTFKTAQEYAVTTNTYGVAAADFTGDGKRDLAYVGTSDGRVAILVNKGNGTFNNATFVTNTFGGKSIFAGDVNGDKKADLVVANPGSDAVSVLLGNGNGTFTKIATDVTGGLAQPNFVTLADLNKDGKLDLVAINEFSDEVRVKLGKGDGTFALGQSFSTASTPTQVAVLDIDRDGKLDLIASCRSDGTTDISGGVSILRGRGDGTFVDQQVRTAHTSPTAVAIADYNNDGKLDIVAANFFSDDVSFLANGTPGARGSIKGTIFSDTNLDGVLTPGEPGLGGQTVFADVDEDGAYDPGERFTRTASDGTYALLDLPAGTFRVRAIVPANLVQHSPAYRAANVVKLAAGQALTGRDIGLVPIVSSGGFVFDNRSAILSSGWTRSTAAGQYAADYVHDRNTDQGTKSARFDLKLPAAGYYQVAARWVAGADRASNAPIDIASANGKRTLTVNQRVNGATWVNLGTYYFNATGGNVTFRTSKANGLVIADAVRLEAALATPTTVTKDNADASGVTITGSWGAATTPSGFVGGNFLQDGNPATKGGRSVRFAPALAIGGVYEIFARWTAGSDRASNARYDIVTASGTSTVLVDQRTRGGAWVSLGFFDANPATVSVTIRNDGANGRVIADAVRFVRVA